MDIRSFAFIQMKQGMPHIEALTIFMDMLGLFLMK
jgi:hypothetical protein